jgi:hypothetical protein
LTVWEKFDLLRRTTSFGHNSQDFPPKIMSSCRYLCVKPVTFVALQYFAGKLAIHTQEASESVAFLR